MINLWENLWDSHGTKILGFVLSICLSLQAADLYLEVLLTRKQHAFVGFITAFVSSMVIKRGYTNSRRNDDESNRGGDKPR
jgi:hypothetical protein